MPDGTGLECAAHVIALELGLRARGGAGKAGGRVADRRLTDAERDRLEDAYLDRDRFASMMLVNTAKAGIFSADRAVREYAERIWTL